MQSENIGKHKNGYFCLQSDLLTFFFFAFGEILEQASKSLYIHPGMQHAHRLYILYMQ